MATGSMTKEEREAFLADVHVAVLAVDEPGRGPLAMPVWYLYEDGQVLVWTEGRSVKAKLMRDAGRATLTVQNEATPYQYVTVEGPVTVEPTQTAASRRWRSAPRAGAWCMVDRQQPRLQRHGARPHHARALAHLRLRQVAERRRHRHVTFS